MALPNPSVGRASTSGGVRTLRPANALGTVTGKVPALMFEALRADDPQAEFVPLCLHDLRHTLKTWMQQARIPKDVRNAVQNHFDGDMDELYGHYSFEKEKREALEAWARHLGKVVAGDRHRVLQLKRL
jgi:hypothetical protein